MEEILELEEIWALIRKLYGKKKEGWSASIGMSKNKLFDLLIKGPDNVIEIIQDQPYPLMLAKTTYTNGVLDIWFKKL
jgi:protein-disulfide isomerase